ncbi:hypothetical protein [Sphingobium sp. YG1]|nr:hypothetical protein [Sphingobium sp. YG1]
MMIEPHDQQRRDREAIQRAERGALGLALVMAAVMAMGIARAWAEGRI